MIFNLFAFAVIAWTAYLVIGFVYGFLKAIWEDLKNRNRYV
jgi:hypothetical protein